MNRIFKQVKRAAIGCALLLAMAVIIGIAFPSIPARAQQVADQVILSMKFVKGGVQSQGAGVLQVGEVNTLSAAVASATRAEVVAAPASGSIYLRGLLLEKVGASGTVTVSYGTGTNCGTGNTVIAGPISSPPAGYLPLGVIVPAAKALCLATDGANTGARALTN